MKYFFFSVFFIVALGLVIVYIKISNYDIKSSETKPKIIKEQKEQNSIIKALNLNEKKIILPAKELYLRIDLNYSPEIVILYQTILNNLNKYTLFGIEQILKLNNIRYSIIKSKNDLKLFINFDKKSQANRIIKLFKSYNFNVKLKEIKIKKGIK
jgi:hypothetical protein